MNEAREFLFSDNDFNFIKQIVGEQTGIVLSDVKRNMVYGRLSRRLRALGLGDFGDYCNLIRSDDKTELANFINAITTNLTSFFRENHHFEYLKNTLVPQLLQKHAHDKRIRIWSAGCSTGEEPYSIAMTLYESIPDIHKWDVKVLATDLDSNVVQIASRGIYSEKQITGMNASYKKRWFHKPINEKEDKVRVSPRLQEVITFKQLNLMHEWPFKGPFDLIFCRNVLIYFSKDTQRTLVERYADKLSAGGHLFLGHSESLFKVTDRFELLGTTIYKKMD